MKEKTSLHDENSSCFENEEDQSDETRLSLVASMEKDIVYREVQQSRQWTSLSNLPFRQW